MVVDAQSSYGQVREWLYGVGREHIVPMEDLTVSEWADENRLLSSRAAAEPGPWRTDRTPYLREIMDALSADSPYEWVVFMKGAQVGGTEAGLNWLGYVIDRSPAPTMLVWPTEQDIKSNVRVRMDPFFESTPCVGRKIGDAQGPKDGANNTFLKEFPGGFLAFAASNSTASLRSKPVCNLMLDEVDEYPGNANQQGDPVTLAEARTRTFGGRRKILAISTPTVQGASRIERLYETTDMRRYYVPCPFCGVYQVLVWEQMRHEQGRPDIAWYECAHCAGKIENHHKVDMLPRGEWRPEKEASMPRRIGFHLSALYSPVGMLSWSTCMSDYHEALGDAQKLRAWTNTVLGESYAEKGERPDWERLYYRRGGYELGTVPDGVLIITAGIDVQKDRIEVEVVGWGRGKTSWSIDYRVFPGDTADLHGEAWNGLRDLMSASYPHPTGVLMPIQCAAIDSGYATTTVYNWAREYNAPKVVVVKGEDSRQQPVGQPGHVDVTLASGRRVRRALKRYPVGVSLLKHELYGWLRMDKPEGSQPPPGYLHFPEYGEEYFKQLTAETYVVHEKRGSHRQRGEWKKTRERNEALDCRIYARAAAAILRIDMFRGPDWDRLELAIGAIPGASVPNPVSAPTTPPPPAGPVARPERRRFRSRGIHQ
jgi:phage terminase large subunit GpA-like protein